MAADRAIAQPYHLTILGDLLSQALCPVQALASLQQHFGACDVVDGIFGVRALPKSEPGSAERARGFRTGVVRFDDD
jgi:hypothetical protein